ncbi:MAG TPA: c-type cytochrome, partial [Candidatus Dormibacteraeota bacterium]|nr:c-type cytochrome [Candidatus Dormibacteraeota bacterium]
MRNLIWFVAGAIALAVVVGAGGVIVLKTGANGFSARAQPSVLERFAARQARAMALPADAKKRTNPVAGSPEVLADARAHWADHCAGCHSNNGSGSAEMGKHMYPPAPDMRQANTQDLTDGELFYIIQNGVRLTGMPSWGSGTAHDEQDSWKLVLFIRYLPKLTAEEEREMETLNPKSPEELKEEEEERKFLNGEQSDEHAQHEH